MESPYCMADDAGRWANRGEVIRILADEVSEPTVKAMMLRIAAEYDRLVRCAEAHGASAENARIGGPGDPEPMR